MGIFKKRIKLGKKSGLNLSKSGVSLSTKLGPLTLNSRGRVSMKGKSIKLGKKKRK